MTNPEKKSRLFPVYTLTYMSTVIHEKLTAASSPTLAPPCAAFGDSLDKVLESMSCQIKSRLDKAAREGRDFPLVPAHKIPEGVQLYWVEVEVP